MRDYPFWEECDLVDRLRCVGVEAEAAGLPWPMLQAITEAAEWLAGDSRRPAEGVEVSAGKR